MEKRVSSFFTYLENNSLLEKKILMKNYYYRYLVVSSTTKFSFHFSIEDFSIVKKTITLPKSYSKKSFLLGYSLSLKDYCFKNVPSFNNSFDVTINFTYFNHLKNLEKVNKAFSSNNGTKALLLLSSSKGGYNVYSFSGIKGFLPRNQLVYNFINKFQLLSETFSSNNLIWLFFKTSKITIVHKTSKENICSFIFLINGD